MHTYIHTYIRMYTHIYLHTHILYSFTNSHIIPGTSPNNSRCFAGSPAPKDGQSSLGRGSYKGVNFHKWGIGADSSRFYYFF